MKYLDEYRDAAAVKQLCSRLDALVTKPWTIMEVCGGQTHSIVRFGLDQLIPSSIRLVHGPGCPVCVTPIEQIDHAISIANTKNVIFCSFGDMLRVPGSSSDLFHAKSHGADVRMVYSPLDAVKIASENQSKQVVFFAVGFETTAPVNALSIIEAKRLGLTNYSILVSHVLVPPAIESIMAHPESRVDGFLAAGHVCTIMGVEQYEPLANKYKMPIVVTGFEPVDLVQGVLSLIEQLEQRKYRVENRYERVVRSEGNRAAQRIISDVFEVVTRRWRGIGEIAESGWALRPSWSMFDASKRFAAATGVAIENNECKSGQVLLGKLTPVNCPAFGTKCTPDHPLGATMVSGEGACAAYYKYRRHELIPLPKTEH